MFTKELAKNLLQIIDERNMTLEGLANVSNLSSKFIGNIASEKQSLTLDSFEKICSALELEPNDLLLNEKSKTFFKSKPMAVVKILKRQNTELHIYRPICPSCDKPLASEWQSYCDVCGQRLSWEKYSKADIVLG